MQVIEHRCNAGSKSDLQEIDVYLEYSDDGFRWRVKHDIESFGQELSLFLSKNKDAKYLVNIKQTLPLQKLEELYLILGDHSLIGFFDVPYPLAYYAEEAGLRIFHRYSEFEKPPEVRRFWIDPLKRQNPDSFTKILDELYRADNLEIIIASPELHGANLVEVSDVWSAIKKYNISQLANYCGIVTKYPKDAEEFFNA